jgi:hypothetical protein
VGHLGRRDEGHGEAVAMASLDDSKVKISDGTPDLEGKGERAEAVAAAGRDGDASNDPGWDVQ